MERICLLLQMLAFLFPFFAERLPEFRRVQRHSFQQHRIGHHRLEARPAVHDVGVLHVGPRSSGAHPGPAFGSHSYSVLSSPISTVPRRVQA